MCSILGAVVFLRAVIFIAVASLGASNPAMAQFSPMPQVCMEAVSHAEAALAGVADAATQECGPQSSHQIVCPLAGCPSAALARISSLSPTSDPPEAASFVTLNTLGAGGSVSPGRRPPIALWS